MIAVPRDRFLARDQRQEDSVALLAVVLLTVTVDASCTGRGVRLYGSAGTACTADCTLNRFGVGNEVSRGGPVKRGGGLGIDLRR